MRVRNAETRDLERLARLWFDGWQDAHARILPEALRELRTLDSFRDRLRAALGRTRVAEEAGEVVGFHTLKDDEVYQLFVDARARGSGVAAALLRDAEDGLRATGVATAWLACAIGNLRAARFYEKCGWQRVATVGMEVETTAGPFELQVWRYEKAL